MPLSTIFQLYHGDCILLVIGGVLSIHIVNYVTVPFIWFVLITDVVLSIYIYIALYVQIGMLGSATSNWYCLFTLVFPFRKLFLLLLFL